MDKAPETPCAIRDVPCPLCRADGPHTVLDDRGGEIVVRCAAGCRYTIVQVADEAADTLRRPGVAA